MRIKQVARLVAGGTPTVDDPSMWADGDDGTPWVAIGDMSDRERVLQGSRSISSLGLRSKRLEVGQPGVILFAMYASVGAVATLGAPATWNQAILGLDVRRDLADPRFVAHWLRHLGGELRSLVRTSTQENLNAEQVGNLPFTHLPLEEQRRIADFLDDQVARLDAAIGRIDSQVHGAWERLDAEWSAQANQTLAEGSVPLRRVLASIVDGPFGSSLTSSHYSDEGTRVIRLGNVGRASFRASDEAFIPNAYAATLRQHAVDGGDLVVAGLGDESWPLGRAAVVPEALGPAIVKADCYRVRLSAPYRHDFAAWYLSSPPASVEFRLLSRGSTRARLNTVVVREVGVPLLAPDRQRAIVASFQRARAATRDSVAALVEMSALLEERKRALITAAVTGEFDISTASTRATAGVR